MALTVNRPNVRRFIRWIELLYVAARLHIRHKMNNTDE